MPIYTIENDTNPIVHFGVGDILICKSQAEDCNHFNEILLIPDTQQNEINSFIDAQRWHNEYEGKSSCDIPVHVRLKFDKPESIDALIAELEELKALIVEARERTS